MSEDTHSDIMLMLGEVRSDIKAILRGNDDTKTILRDHGARLKQVEENQSLWKGQIILIGALVSLVASTSIGWVANKLGLQ